MIAGGSFVCLQSSLRLLSYTGMLSRAARSALLAGQPSSAGNVLVKHMQSDVSAASYQVLDTILSQAHRVCSHPLSAVLGLLQVTLVCQMYIIPGHALLTFERCFGTDAMHRKLRSA